MTFSPMAILVSQH